MNGHIIRNTGSAVTVEMPSGERVDAPSVVAALDMVEQSRSMQCTCPSGDGSLRWPCPAHQVRDPRTVAGVDVSFPTEKHMNFAPDEKCDCHRCIAEQGLGVGGLPLNMLKMILCPVCGNKRCPKANDHRNDCTDSNEPGQPGSAYQ